MSPINRKTIEEKLFKLQETIKALNDLKAYQKEEFVKENKDMAKFRNKLIHDYDRVSLDQVYEHLQKAPDIFRQFSKHFINFLENKQ